MKFIPSLLLLILISLLPSCNELKESPSGSLWQTFSGRDDGFKNPVDLTSPTEDFKQSRPLLYRAMTPSDWMRKDPSPTESIADTMKPIAEFSIQEGEEVVAITLHTFPVSSEIPSIPAPAQISRWKRQFDPLDIAAAHTEEEAHGGFKGIFFEGSGILNGTPTMVLAWSMQLAPAYIKILSQEKHSLNIKKRADYTIKAIGPPSLLQKHRSDIVAFARSFELIDELPSP